MNDKDKSVSVLLASITGLSGDRRMYEARVMSQGAYFNDPVTLDPDRKYRFERTAQGVDFSKIPDASNIEIGTEVVFLPIEIEGGKIGSTKWGLADSWRMLRSEEARDIQQERLDRKGSPPPFPRSRFSGFMHI